jgi:hypothetical protein
MSFALVVIAFFVFVPPIPQDQRFHSFADGRTIAGIPNFWNVVSNLLFAVVGILGLKRFASLADRILFAGVLLTAFGSAYYHLAPSDARLVWDRLPMTVIFMAFVALASVEPRDLEPSPWLLCILIALGTGSVLWWSVTGDLRPYAVVKFGPILYLAPVLVSSTQRKYIWPIVGLFALAQALEMADKGVYSDFLLSGHTLKHMVAALATLAIFRWRKQCSTEGRDNPVARYQPIRGAA